MFQEVKMTVKNQEVFEKNQGVVRQAWRRQCRLRPGKAGFADGCDERVWEAIELLLGEDALMEAYVFADESKDLFFQATRIQTLVSRWSDRIRIIKVSESSGLSPLQAAAECLGRGEVDSVLAGNISTTADVIRAAIKGVGLKVASRTVSGSFLMVSPEGEELIFADCGVVVKPSVEQLVEIASSSVDTWRALVPHKEPRVAFLSFSTMGSASHAEAQKMRDAARSFKALYPQLVADGEVQFDAAYVPQVARSKCPQSPLEGRANCLIFPDLNAGNIGYKLVQRLGGFEAYGPILQGLAKPYSDLSRGASVQDIVSCTYINQVRAGLGPSS